MSSGDEWKEIPVAILVGGRGTRLASVSNGVPKPLLMINGKPHLQNVIDKLERLEIREVILLCSYRHDLFIEYAEKLRSKLKLKLKVVDEGPEKGTFGAVYGLLSSNIISAEQLYVMNGDTIVEPEFRKLHALSNGKDPVIQLAYMRDTHRYGRVRFHENEILEFLEKDSLGEPGFVNAGVYLLSSQDVLAQESSMRSIESEYFRSCAIEGHLYGVISKNAILDFGTPESLVMAREGIIN